MRAFLLIIMAGLWGLTSAGQSDPSRRSLVKGLWNELASASSDTARIHIELQLAGHYFQLPGDTATRLMSHALALSRKINHTKSVIEVLRLYGVYYEVVGKDYQKALDYYKEGLDVAISASSDLDKHDFYGNILNLYFYRGEFINAMRIASDGLALSEKNKDRLKTANYHNVIGFIHLRQRNFNAAEHHYRLYYGLTIQTNDSTTIGDALNNLGEVLLEKKDFTGALNSFGEAHKIFFLLNETGGLNKKDRLAYVLFQQGYAYGSMGEIEKAIRFTTKALEYSNRYSCNIYDVARYNIYSGQLHLQSRRYETALKFLRTGMRIATSINHKETTRDAYLYLHRLFAEKKQYDSAYLYYSRYDALKDSIVNETTLQAIREMENSYQLEKKDVQIDLLNQEKKVQEAEIRRQGLFRNVVILFFTLIILVIVLVVNRIHLKRKNRLQSEINEKQTEMFHLTAVVQDKERKRIAQDLHDGMGTLLSAAKLKLSSLPVTLPEVGDTLALLDDATTELRNVSHNIMPAALSRLGLIPALKNLAEKISETKDITIDVISHGTGYRLPEEKEIFIYRIILELVNNIVKHSKATVVTIQLVRHAQHINITVEDNGTGFNNERPAKGMGLSNVRSRVQFLQGSCHIDSSADKGTIVIIDIPC